MDPRTFPTKGNLMLAKNSLALAKQGYDLMDKKRNILIRELMDLIDEARSIQEEIDTTFTYAYQCLQRANIENGISNVELLAYTVPIENSITIQTRSIMGTEIPHVKYVPDAGKPTYSFSTTHESIDKAREAFRKVKDLTVKLSMVENAAYRLASNIKNCFDHGLVTGDYISRGEDPIYGGLAFFYCHFSPFLLPFSLCPLFFTYFLRIFHT